MVVMKLGKFLFSTLRRSFFLPNSYNRSALPTPTSSRPFERAQRAGDTVQRGLVHELHGALLQVPVQVHEASVAVARREGEPAAVPTARKSSPAAGKYTWHTHNAASFPVISTTCFVDASDGFTMRTQLAHDPGGAFGAPNCSAGVIIGSSSPRRRRRRPSYPSPPSPRVPLARGARRTARTTDPPPRRRRDDDRG